MSYIYIDASFHVQIVRGGGVDSTITQQTTFSNIGVEQRSFLPASLKGRFIVRLVAVN